MRYSLTILFLFHILFAFGQEGKQGKYWLTFTDKATSKYSIFQPQNFLSARAIERREQQGIAITEEDLPVNETYLAAVQLTGATILNKSKWMNSTTILASDAMLIELNKLPFVKEVLYVGKDFAKKNTQTVGFKTGIQKVAYATSESVYGYGQTSIEMVQGQALHEIGNRGEGKMIAILDGGFTNADIMPFFEKMRMDGRIIEGWDFVDNDATVYESSAHGSQVLSVMGADLPGLFTGTAPKATYVLFKTEDVRGEYLFEECNWIAGVEYADSMGVDIINSSLGYTTFSDLTMNYKYLDMDGETSMASKAADIAFSKGLMIVSSAGNSGDNQWRYIGTPADARGVLAVGATDEFGEHAMFSSFGPTADGRVKPNVAALGQSIPVASIYSYNVHESHGTSFSSPLIAGMVATLWQSFPDKTNKEIFNAIEASGNNKDELNYNLGHGIPDFWKAYQILLGENVEAHANQIDNAQLSSLVGKVSNSGNVIIPISCQQKQLNKFEIQIKDQFGNIVFSKNENAKNRNYFILNLNADLNLDQSYSVSIYTKEEVFVKSLKLTR